MSIELMRRLVGKARRESADTTAYEIPLQDILWGLGSVCAVHRRAFDPQLLLRELPTAPVTTDELITAARSLGFRIQRRNVTRASLATYAMPCLALLVDHSPREGASTPPESPPHSPRARITLIAKITDTQVVLFRAGTNQVTSLSFDEFDREFTGNVIQVAPVAEAVSDPDGIWRPRAFGFRWFVPELLKHRRVWRDVLIGNRVVPTAWWPQRVPGDTERRYA